MSKHALVIVLAICASRGVAGAQAHFEVDRTRIDLSESAPAAAVTLSNHGRSPLRLSLAAFRWHDDIAGAMQLEPTTDVVVRPALIEIPPGASRVVRVATVARAGAVEASFRVFAEELPDRRAASTPGIAVRTRVAIPVFIAPHASPSPVTLAPIVTLANGTASIEVHGDRARHVKLATIVVRGTRAGVEQWSHQTSGWYVLPGATRRFSIDLAGNGCGDAERVTAEVVDEDGVRWVGPPLPCP